MFSQCDERWSRVRLGFSTQTLGQAGCLVTCVAEMIQDHTTLDPADLNRWLCLNSGYTDKNRLRFEALEPLGLVFRSAIDYSSTPADLGLLRLRCAAGNSVLVEVAFDPYRSNGPRHWLRVLAWLGGDVLVHDPWLMPADQAPVRLLPRYARPEWDLARAILRIAVYARKEG